MRHFGVVVGVSSTLFLTAVGAASVAIASQSGNNPGQPEDATAAGPDIAAMRAAAASASKALRATFGQDSMVGSGGTCMRGY